MKKNDLHGIQERRTAAAPVLAQIATLARQPNLNRRVAEMLAYTHSHLFDRELNVKSLRAACGIADNSIAIVFHMQVGKTPAVFISESRLAVADNLLAASNLPIWQIAQLLGYSSIQVFSRAFWRSRGTRPSDARKGRKGIPVPREAPHDLLAEALAGRLDEATAKDLIRRLLAAYPQVQL